jgi:hypothetical protein
MHLARRLVTAAVVAALGIGGLTACRSQPGIAAYVGDQQITEETVTAWVDGAVPAAGQDQQEPSPGPSVGADEPPPVSRQEAVDLAVSLDLGKQIVAEKNIQVQDQVTAEQVAAELGVAPGSEYARMFAEWISVAQAILATEGAAAPTDEQIMTVYQQLVAAGAIEPNLPLADVKQAFGDGQFVSSASALADQLAAKADTNNASINPRYLPLAAPLFVTANGRPVFYQLPYVEGSGAVTDRS